MGDFKEIHRMLRNVVRYVEEDVPEIVGSEAENHFKESFQNEGFTDDRLEKWDDVKRRDSSSTWYGFKHGSKTKKPARHPSRKGVKRKYMPRKENPVTNYSKAATKWKVLKGSTGDLKNSIRYKVQGNTVIVYSDKEYAEVQNEGGEIKIFGKKTVKLKARPFMKHSKKLKQKILAEIEHDLQRILK